jgi:unsaturated chondroitin disaccharide hydrolase
MVGSSKRKKMSVLIICGILLSLINSCSHPASERYIIRRAEDQVLLMLEEIRQLRQIKNEQEVVSPRSLNPGGELVMVRSRDWTSGFFPGILWYLYELTGHEEWKIKAMEFTGNIENEKYNGGTHDMGFKIFCSFGNGFRLSGDMHYRHVIIHSARTLISRYNSETQCIRSWDHNQDKWDFPVIIDNLMNLELLFAASEMTGDPLFHEIAVNHANTTMKNHFRPDFSTYHVIDYDTITGDVVKKNTHQGYSHESTWARGQAWALYGYTMCYRATKNRKYLDQAEKIAGFILNHLRLPEDLIPYWDFDAPGIPDEPRDASAAAITASALYELSTYSGEKQLYKKKADTIMKNLASGYLAEKGTNRGFILLHSTGSAPSNSEVDVPLIYGDYYFLEALVRSKRLESGKPVV